MNTVKAFFKWTFRLVLLFILFLVFFMIGSMAVAGVTPVITISENINSIFFVLGCVGMTSAICAINFKRKVGLSWSIKILGAIGILLNGYIVFIALVELITGHLEVEGIVERIYSDALIGHVAVINVDESYRDQYNYIKSYSNSEICCILPVDISYRTRFYKRYGILPWQKKRVDFNSLQEDQRIQVRYMRAISSIGPEVGQIIILDE